VACAFPSTSQLVAIRDRPLGRILGSELFHGGPEPALIKLSLLLMREPGTLSIIFMESWEEDAYERAFPTLSKSEVRDIMERNIPCGLRSM
jgi:hypothetical protein